MKEMLKTRAIMFWTLHLVEENRTSGHDTGRSYRYRDKYRRSINILEKRYGICTEINDYDNLTFKES